MSGYVVDFTMYSGMTSSLHDTVFGLVGRFVGQGYHIFMDNYYNSVQLAQEMFNKGIHLSGTLRLNRGAPQVLRHIAHYKVMAIGDTVFRKKGDVFVVLWRSPARIVPMITNSGSPVTEEYTYRKKGGRNRPYVEIPMSRPKVIRHYTAYMGGVDLFDQMVNYYSFARRTVRWSKKVVMYLLQLAIQNSFALYTKYSTDRKKMNLLEYMNFVAESLATFDATNWPATGTPIARAASLPREERLDRLPPTPQGQGPTPPSGHAAQPMPSEHEEDVDDPRSMSPPPAGPSAAPSVATPGPSAALAVATPGPSAAPAVATPTSPPVPRNDPIRPLDTRIYTDPEIRLQRGDHTMTILPGVRIQRRCRVCYVSGIRRDTRYYCSLCRVPLCNKGTCYTDYHSKERFWKIPAQGTTAGVRSRRNLQ